VDSCGIFGVGFSINTIGIMALRVAPAADFEAELAVERFLGGHAVEFVKAPLLAELPNDSFPLRALGNGCAWREARNGVFAWTWSQLRILQG
jgi:hypothetical protein